MIVFGISSYLLTHKTFSDDDPFSVDSGIPQKTYSRLPASIAQPKSVEIKRMFNLTGNIKFVCRRMPEGGVTKTWSFGWGSGTASDNGEFGHRFVLEGKDGREILKSNRPVRAVVVDSTRAFALYGSAHLMPPQGGIALIEKDGGKFVWREIFNTSSGIPVPLGEGLLKRTGNPEGVPVFWFAVMAASGPRFLIAIEEDGRLWIEDAVVNVADDSNEWEAIIVEFISGGDVAK